MKNLFVKNGHIENLLDDSGFPAEIEICKTDEQFEKWIESESDAAEKDSEIYVKLRTTEDGVEIFTIKEANEYIDKQTD